MRKFDFSSQTKKPLLFFSLILSVALHGGGLYFLFKHPFSFFGSSLYDDPARISTQQVETDLEKECALLEALNHFIIKEDESSSLSLESPHLETVDENPLIMTNFAYKPDIDSTFDSFPFLSEEPSFQLSQAVETQVPHFSAIENDSSQLFKLLKNYLSEEILLTQAKRDTEQRKTFELPSFEKIREEKLDIQITELFSEKNLGNPTSYPLEKDPFLDQIICQNFSPFPKKKFLSKSTIFAKNIALLIESSPLLETYHLRGVKPLYEPIEKRSPKLLSSETETKSFEDHFLSTGSQKTLQRENYFLTNLIDEPSTFKLSQQNLNSEEESQFDVTPSLPLSSDDCPTINLSSTSLTLSKKKDIPFCFDSIQLDPTFSIHTALVNQVKTQITACPKQEEDQTSSYYISKTDVLTSPIKQIARQTTPSIDVGSQDFVTSAFICDQFNVPRALMMSYLSNWKQIELPEFAFSSHRSMQYSDDKKFHAYRLQKEKIEEDYKRKLSKEFDSLALPNNLINRFSVNAPLFHLEEMPFTDHAHFRGGDAFINLPKGEVSVALNQMEKTIPLSSPPLAPIEQQIAAIDPSLESVDFSTSEMAWTSFHIQSLASSQISFLDIDGGEKLTLKENSKNLFRKGIKTDEILAMPSLPHLKQKQLSRQQTFFKPSKALEDCSEIETFLALILRKESSSNIKKLLMHKSFPEAEIYQDSSTRLALAKEVKPPQITDKASQEMIETYHVEILDIGRSTDLSDPGLETTSIQKAFHVLNETHRFTEEYLSHFPKPTNLDTISFQNDFETRVSYVESSDGKGYHFALKIKPNKKLYFGSPEQNFVFILDSSGSIKKHRYNTFKDAIMKSLGYVQKGDSFNILVADSEIAAMYPKSINWSKEAIKEANRYLETRSYRGYFSNYNAFHLLSQASQYFDPNKENIVILMTDGHSLGNIKMHKEALRKLQETSKNQFSLFTASAGQANNIPMLDLVSTFNSGELMYSPTNAAFPRKLAVLVKHIENLIAKDIHIHVTSPKDDLDVQFYPNQGAYPSLYADQSYTLYGSIDKLEDFDLILQGRSGNQWVNIKQRISFTSAEKAGYKLKRNFALQQAYVCYDYYLKKNDPFFLAEAERILTPHHLDPATR